MNPQIKHFQQAEINFIFLKKHFQHKLFNFLFELLIFLSYLFLAAHKNLFRMKNRLLL